MFRCRFYENQFPEPEEVVMVNVTQIGEMGAYVTLLEYNDIEGMILLSELSRRRIRSINKLVRVNRTEIVMVIRVDKEKGATAAFATDLLQTVHSLTLFSMPQNQVISICPSGESTPRTWSSARSVTTRLRRYTAC